MTDKQSSNLLAAIAVVGAVVVASSGNDGWGWLIFIAILVAE